MSAKSTLKLLLSAPAKLQQMLTMEKVGPPLSSVRILNEILYTVGPFIYTSYSSPSKPAREPPADDLWVVPGGY